MATERLRVILEMVTTDYKKGAKDATRATDGITKSGKEADKALSGAGRSMQSIGPAKAAGIIAAGGAIAVQVGKAIKALDELGVQADNIRNKFSVVFGDGAEEVEEWADEVNERFGLSQVAVQDLAANFADLLVPIGFTREEATGLTKDALQLANALSEWSGGQIDVAEATDVVRKALLGEREGLKALNVSILQSDVNARVAANGQAGLTGELKAQAEAQATLQLITDKSADAIAAYENNTNDALITQKGFEAAILDSKQALADFVTDEVDTARGGLVLLALILEDVTNQLKSGQGEAGSLLLTLLDFVPGVTDASTVLQGLANNYGNTRLAQKGLIDGMQRLKVLLPAVNFDPLTQAGQSFITTQEEMEASTQGVVDEITELARESGLTQETLSRLADRGVDAVAEALGVSKNEAENLIPILRRVADELDPKVYDDYEGRLQALGRGFNDQADAAGNLADETNEAALASKRLADETVNTAGVLKAQANPLFKAIRAYQNLVDVQEDIAEGGVTLEEQITELAPAFLESKEAIEDLGDGNLERGIEVIASAIGVATDDVRAFLLELGLLDQLGSIDLAIRVLYERATAGTEDPSIAAAARRAGIADKAYGGPVSAGRSYMVGERGPEFFTPTSSGRISSGPLGDSGGGVTINLNVTTQPGFSNQVVREMEQALSRYRAGVS